ncbi:ABC transporter ATP-binding protein [Calidifontibacter terrae]
MNQFAARARGVAKYYGEIVALDGVDLDVEPGEVHGLVGPNGAGKTTLLGLMLGLSVADRGTLEVLGSPVRTVLGVPDGVAGFVDAPGLYPSLTARENLAAIARLRGARADIDAALEQVGLRSVADDRLRGFSLGMRQRLGLAAALVVRPRLLVLDEPSNGLDPAGKQQVHRVIRELAANGAAVMISSHRMDDLEALCQQVSVLSAGRMVFSGSIAKLAAENGALDHRLVTSDAAAARRAANGVSGVTVMAGGAAAPTDPVVVRAAAPDLDRLIPALVAAGVAVRELTPLVSPLETAFLKLTEIDQEVGG